ARGQLRQPALLLLLGAVVQDVGRHDAGMERRTETVEAGERDLAVDHRFVTEGAAGTAILLRHGGAQQARLAGFRPHGAVHDAVLVPLLHVRHELGREEAPRLLLEQDEILGHPVRTRHIEDVHHNSPRATCAWRTIPAEIESRTPRRQAPWSSRRRPGYA